MQLLFQPLEFCTPLTRREGPKHNLVFARIEGTGIRKRDTDLSEIHVHVFFFVKEIK